jgi:hypothetical protein
MKIALSLEEVIDASLPNPVAASKQASYDARTWSDLQIRFTDNAGDKSREECVA